MRLSCKVLLLFGGWLISSTSSAEGMFNSKFITCAALGDFPSGRMVSLEYVKSLNLGVPIKGKYYENDFIIDSDLNVVSSVYFSEVDKSSGKFQFNVYKKYNPKSMGEEVIFQKKSFDGSSIDIFKVNYKNSSFTAEHKSLGAAPKVSNGKCWLTDISKK